MATTLTFKPAENPAGVRTVRALILLEALRPTTGPAKNAIEFARRARNAASKQLQVNAAIATFLRQDGPASDELLSFCLQLRLETHVIPEQFAFDFRVLPAIRRLIESYQPDVIETHSVKSHFLIWLTRAYEQRQWIAFHHGYTQTSARARLYSKLDRWSLRAASQVVTDCHPFADELQRIGVYAERIAVQHSAVSEFAPPSREEVSELRRALGISEAARVILSVGRLSREKGHSDLIEALSHLAKKESVRNVCVVVAGDGPDREILRKKCETERVANAIRFVGHVTNIAPYYGLADMLVLPSHSEGSPNVLLEAMAAGVPVVATRVGGIPEIVTNEREALLVERGDPRALARSMERLLCDENLGIQLAQGARQKSRTYSPGAYCESLLALYENCLARSPRSSVTPQFASAVRAVAMGPRGVTKKT